MIRVKVIIIQIRNKRSINFIFSCDMIEIIQLNNIQQFAMAVFSCAYGLEY